MARKNSKTASWVIKNRKTGEIIMETFDESKVRALNTAKYIAVPIQEHLQDINRELRSRRNPVPASSSRAGIKAKQLQGERLLEDFTGHPPKRIDKFRKPQYDDVVIAFGECEGVLYKTVRDGETEHYIHKFRAKSRPLLAVSEDGTQLYLLGGKYLFTDRGIVDK